MATTTYSYKISEDFLSGILISNLISEIQNSAIVTALDLALTRVDGDDVSVVFKDALSAGDKTLLDNDTTNPAGGLIAAHDPTPPTPVDQVSLANEVKDQEGKLIVSLAPRSGSEALHVSHNLCDPCTWYQESTRHVDVGCDVLDVGIGLHFDIPGHVNLIDMRHGRTHGENQIVSGDIDDGGHGWSIEVKSDSVVLTEHTPLKGQLVADVWNRTEDGDYWIDHEAGEIWFKTAQLGKTVEITFSKAGSSKYTVDSLEMNGDNDVEYAEAQFSTDLQMESDLEIQFYGVVDVFAPELVPVPYPSGTIIPLLVNAVGAEVPWTYKTKQNFIDEATKAWPIIKATGHPNHPRSSPDMQVYTFEYQAKRELIAAGMMKMEIRLKDDIPWTGNRATVSFYGVEKTS